MAVDQPVIARYRATVSRAARKFSQEFSPGAVLSEAADVAYIYNPENCPSSTLTWLEEHPIKTFQMADARPTGRVSTNPTNCRR